MFPARGQELASTCLNNEGVRFSSQQDFGKVGQAMLCHRSEGNTFLFNKSEGGMLDFFSYFGVAHSVHIKYATSMRKCMYRVVVNAIVLPSF